MARFTIIAICNVMVAFLLSFKMNRLIMFISLAGMIVSLLLNFINVPYFGAIGAAYTSMGVYFLMAVSTFYFARKYYGLRRKEPAMVTDQRTEENIVV